MHVMENVLFVFLCLYYVVWCQDLKNATLPSPSPPPKTDKSCRCRLNMHDILNIRRHPIYLNATTYQTLYPNDNYFYYVLIDSGEDIELYCTHPDGFLIDDQPYYRRKLVLKCLYLWEFETLGKTVDIRNIRCAKSIKPSTRFSARPCGFGGKEIVVGFHLSEKRFVRLYFACFNFEAQITEYARSSIYPLDTWERAFQLRRNKKCDFFRLSRPVSYFYRHSNFAMGLDAQLGRPANKTLNTTDADKKLVRAFYLVTPINYIYIFEQIAGLYYINVIPQISEIPWYYIRRALHEYAYNHRVKLTVYTGILLEPTTLQHENGSFVPIYLDYPDRRIPIPEIIWKVVFDKKRLTSVAIIGVNNDQKAGKFTPMCADVSSQLPWMNPHDRQFMYACKVSDWFQIVNNSFPNVGPQKLLGTNFFYPKTKNYTATKFEYSYVS